MPWASNGQVSTDPIEGGIEISYDDYVVAIEGIVQGKVVIVDDNGFQVVEPPSPDPDPTPDVPLIEQFRWGIQMHVDSVAYQKQYDNGISCASYVNSTNQEWAAQAQCFIAWRDAVWSYAFVELDKVQNGQRPLPSIEEFIAELPVIEWPSGGNNG